MHWFRLYTSFVEDEKWEHTEDSIVPHLQALYVAGCTWAAENETDGALPRKVARFAPYWLRPAMQEHATLQSWTLDDLANELCLLRLWEAKGEQGYKIAGWLKRNVSKRSLDQQREAGRKGGQAAARNRKQFQKGSTPGSRVPSTPPCTELRVKEVKREQEELILKGDTSANKPTSARQVEEVWNHYLASGLVDRPAACVLSKKRKQRLRARFKDGFTVQTLKDAIDGIQKDPWRMESGGHNRRTFDVIFRSAEQVELFEKTNREPPKRRLEKGTTEARVAEIIHDEEIRGKRWK